MLTIYSISMSLLQLKISIFFWKKHIMQSLGDVKTTNPATLIHTATGFITDYETVKDNKRYGPKSLNVSRNLLTISKFSSTGLLSDSTF